MNAIEKQTDALLSDMVGEFVHIKIPIGSSCCVSGQLIRSAAQPAKQNPHFGLTYYQVRQAACWVRFCAADIHAIADRNTAIYLK